MISVSHGHDVCPSCLQTLLEDMCTREQDTVLAVKCIVTFIDDLAAYLLSRDSADIATYKHTFLPRIQALRDLLSDDEDDDA
jgi:hypothetical protein